MAHSWEHAAVPPDVPKASRFRSIRGRIRSVSGPALGVPLRLIGVACLCLGVGTTLVANSAPETGPSLSLSAPRTPSPSAVSVPVPPPLRQSIKMSPNSLIAPQSTSGLIPAQMPRLDPGTLCNLLDVGKKPSKWAQSLVFDGEWECLSTGKTMALSPEAPSQAQPAKTKDDVIVLFTMARGTREGLVSYVRMKISAPDDADASAGAAKLAERVTTLFEAMKWPLPERIPISMRLLQPFDIKEGGTHIRFVKELMTEGRYNLILTFPAENTRILNDDVRDMVVLFHASNRL